MLSKITSRTFAGYKSPSIEVGVARNQIHDNTKEHLYIA
jgi:hypothetical protein